MRLFLSPHNDDECLFGAYTLLRERPGVVVVFRSERQGALGVSAAVREAETDAAMGVLGCVWEQWPFGDLLPQWHRVEKRLLRLDPERVWAPWPEPNGHEQHNFVGEVAGRLWPGRVTFYTTYTPAGRSVGRPVSFEPGWPELKREALACYRSQIELDSTAAHFVRPLDEFYA